MTDFKVDNRMETRSDNVDLRGYRVRLNGKTYLLYYNQDQLKEVYFMARFKNYFMSCRPDMKTISHYYIINKGNGEKSLIKRYENGIHNRTYTMESRGVTTCIVNGIKIVYTVHSGVVITNHTKFYNDLINFLDKFNQLKLYDAFCPKEPNQN